MKDRSLKFEFTIEEVLDGLWVARYNIQFDNKLQKAERFNAGSYEECLKRIMSAYEELKKEPCK